MPHWEVLTARVRSTLAGIVFCAAMNLQIVQPMAAQQSNLRRPAFEVASVKLSPEGALVSLHVENGTLRVRAMGLLYLVAWAYGKDPASQLTGPEWARYKYIDIVAKAPGPVPESEVRLMLRTLLEERFKLRAHLETKVTAIAALIVDKASSQLKESEGEGPWRRVFDTLNMKETFTRITMKELAAFAGMGFRTGAVDRTGLPGRYNFVLDYRNLIDPTDPHPVRALIQSRPEAIRQIGLRFQAIKLPLEGIVVDSLEKVPEEN